MKTVRVFAGLVALTLAGCGDSDGLVPVTGKVTFDGAQPPAAGFVTFMPTERVAGKASRPARAVFDVDGAFAATSFKEGDGILPGKYTISVTCNKGDVDYSQKDPFRAASYVADDYAGQELVIEVGSDDVTVDVDVPLKKK